MSALLLYGCKDLDEGAREDFSRSHTCPLDRVEARERTDLRPSALHFGANKPPAEVAADPGRLKMWQDEQARDAEKYDGRYKTFEVRGCGHLELLTCARGSKNMNRATCSRADYPAGVAKWQ